MESSKIGFVSLGCPKALVDSERILTQLKIEGYEVVNSYDDADVVVINTCGFIDSAVEESLGTIGEAMAENGRVIVTGCLGARSEIIEEKYPNVLAITGAHAYEDVMNAVHEHAPPVHNPHTSLIPPQGVRLTPRHYAYLKISEGCHHKCTFCIIPSMRGTLVSRPIGDILTEAQHLVEAGVKELLVVAQDTSAYGLDIKYLPGFWQGRSYRSDFETLVKALGSLGVWVRLHYVYPYPHVDKILPLMSDNAVLPYLDIPFQHSSPSVLKNMKRPAASEKIIHRLEQWRDVQPDITIRSTFIVGFPGETDQDFRHLLSFLQEAQLDKVGCFPYSPVEGAVANDIEGEVSESEKEDRWHEFMSVQKDISEAKLQHKVGKTMTVIIDEIDGDDALARSMSEAPEVDGNVVLDGYDELPIGEFFDVTVTEAGEYDVWAEPHLE
ncbi:MAG: 30S ribosomal protein S12 methylthiotransferase RimO [Methylococcales bacterium]|jgi:ribosomal protein S12 methylthiotransferase|nr:30S ribosomal protein S12 methylthiotransferase RimO [Methylococcales bacterium]MBT7445339.1 30S ribosomal protein S12 methylthiotransferase RimO [Methylococcales bacterium]